ncbi:MAG TPA: hypothetical protein VHD83_24505 [Puia sp.]|nr:hypothetical protein [Puia sp.]
MSLHTFIFSPEKKHRRIRHLVFWAAYASYFYMQSISPDCIRELDRKEVFSYAFVSLYCFIPVCAFSVYVSLTIFYHFIHKKKQYLLTFGGYFVLFGFCIFLNYFFSILFFHGACHCDVDKVPFMRKFALGYINSQNAIVAGVVALGIRLTRNWYAQVKENLLLAQKTARTALDLEKMKLHPDFLLGSLDNIVHRIRTGSPDAPDKIVDLSDKLSRWLYEEEGNA